MLAEVSVLPQYESPRMPGRALHLLRLFDTRHGFGVAAGTSLGVLVRLICPLHDIGAASLPRAFWYQGRNIETVI